MCLISYPIRFILREIPKIFLVNEICRSLRLGPAFVDIQVAPSSSSSWNYSQANISFNFVTKVFNQVSWVMILFNLAY